MKTNQSLTTTNFIGYAQEEYENLKPLIEITKAFVRSSNQYIYIIDFLKKDFLYVSDKIVRLCIIRKSKFPQNPKRSVRFSGKRTKRSVQKRKARNTQKAETKVL